MPEPTKPIDAYPTSGRWRKVDDELPPVSPDPLDDYGAWRDTVNVLLYSKLGICLGHAQLHDDPEERPVVWRMDGPDGYEIEGVTHWMPLPEEPRYD